MVSWTFILLLCLGTFSLAQQIQVDEPKLIFIESIFRHGARNPFNILHIGD